MTRLREHEFPVVTKFGPVIVRPVNCVPADKPSMSGGRCERTVISGVTQKLARAIADELNRAYVRVRGARETRQDIGGGMTYATGPWGAGIIPTDAL